MLDRWELYYDPNGKYDELYGFQKLVIRRDDDEEDPEGNHLDTGEHAYSEPCEYVEDSMTTINIQWLTKEDLKKLAFLDTIKSTEDIEDWVPSKEALKYIIWDKGIDGWRVRREKE